MNIRNLLLAATLAAVSGAAFAGKAPVILGGFQSTGISIVPKSLAEAADAKEEKREEKK